MVTGIESEIHDDLSSTIEHVDDNVPADNDTDWSMIQSSRDNTTTWKSSKTSNITDESWRSDTKREINHFKYSGMISEQLKNFRISVFFLLSFNKFIFKNI